MKQAVSHPSSCPTPPFEWQLQEHALLAPSSVHVSSNTHSEELSSTSSQLEHNVPLIANLVSSSPSELLAQLPACQQASSYFTKIIRAPPNCSLAISPSEPSSMPISDLSTANSQLNNHFPIGEWFPTPDDNIDCYESSVVDSNFDESAQLDSGIQMLTPEAQVIIDLINVLMVDADS
ncbi:hypothetical protein PENTCL1PPCAC_29828, partial [Pristionchus entomophagus]